MQTQLLKFFEDKDKKAAFEEQIKFMLNLRRRAVSDENVCEEIAIDLKDFADIH